MLQCSVCLSDCCLYGIVAKRCVLEQKLLTAYVVPYELYELYDWGKVPELYGTIGILHFTGQSVVVADSSACSTHHVPAIAP